VEEKARASLYERIGGEAAVEAAVVGFYERVMSDGSLTPFFANVGMDAQIRKQIAFMTMAFGGPNRYTGRDLRVAHARLVAKGLDDAHYDAVLEHLRDTLVELGVDEATTAQVLGLVGGMRADVLGR
jgi:hemoglobin